MSKSALVGVALAAAFSLAACVTATENTVNMLAAAGFKVKTVDSQDKVNALKALPPHKFVMKTQGSQVIYLYADPTICQCIYYGDQNAYQAYQQMAFQQRIADKNLIAATMMQDTGWNYWGAWGPGPWWY
ncbi:hypothetical protein [Microvirga flavescens]|uniref:hypothetical protein n=1 Tax=Microvirga flavescens TaxID=2249811 RepID=UPI001FE0D172|nr:hypothetical protein [Microvirga flavescens]